jgi:hypothetical protein
MRLLVAAAVAGTFLALPSSALAQGGTPLCVGPKSSAEAAGQAALLPYLGNRSAENAAIAALGTQYVGFWWDARHQGWAVALSPGALDVETGKAAILAELTARFPPDAAALLSSTLAVHPTRYSGTELVAAHEHVIAMAVAQPDFVTGHGISCHDSDAYRVLVWIGPEATPEVVARATALFGGLGDIVRLEYGRPVVPLAGTVPAVPAIDPARFATMPKAARCVRGKAIGVRAADDAALRSVTLRAGKRSVTAKRGQRAQLALKSRATRVTLTVSLRDGRTATQTFTYRRCG